MNITDFEKIVHAQIEQCQALLLSKGKEYAPYAYESDYIEQTNGQLTLNIDAMTDRLYDFKKAAVIMNMAPKAALLGMLSKHIVSVADMCTDGKSYSIDRWSEKITDSINYLLILRAMVEEEAQNAKHRNSDIKS